MTLDAETNARLEPPREAIMAGYNMMKARQAAANGRYWEDYLSTAIECAELAQPKIVEQTDAFYMQFSRGFRLLWEAWADLDERASYYRQRAAAEKIGEAHEYFRRLMKRLGYRTITDRDFAQFGSGGGR